MTTLGRGSEEKQWSGRWASRQLEALLADDGRRHRALLTIGCGALGLFTALAYFTLKVEQLPLDLGTTRGLQRIHFAAFGRAMTGISVPGYFPWNALMIASATIGVGRWLGWRHGAFVAGLTATQGIVNDTMKRSIGRVRPLDTVVEILSPAAGHSFPSGHVMFYTVFFGFLFFLFWSRLLPSPLRSLLLLVTGTLVLLIGPSRIYLGVHWLSDVIAARLVSLTILLSGIEVYVMYIALPSANKSLST